MTTKKCIHCGIEKEATRDNFYYQDKEKKSLSNTCIICKKKQKIKRKNRNKVPQRVSKVPQGSPKNKNNKKIEEETIIKESLNGLNTDLKAIEKYKKLTQDIIVLMRKNRIEKYGINTQNLILEMMSTIHQHLTKELRIEVIEGKEVIEINEWK